MFVVEINSKSFSFKNNNKLTFLQKVNGQGSQENTYRVIGNNHLYFKNILLQLLSQNSPNTENNRYISYIPTQSNSQKPNIMKLLNLLEILDLSSYEIRGGANVEVFVRINDPMKLRYLSQGKYYNSILRDIESKHKSATKIVNCFFQKQLTTEQRWDIIENYFLGNEAYVKAILGVSEE